MTTGTGYHADLGGLHVLVVDDEKDIRTGLGRLVGTLGANVSLAADGAEALQVIERDGADLVLTDLMMPRMSGSELLSAVKERFPGIQVIVLTGFGTIQSAVSCLQAGAAHFMTKPFENEDVLNLVTRLGRQVLARRDDGDMPAGTVGGMVAEDPAMLRALQLVEQVASSPVPVLVEGESGTGKELVARTIHDQSPLHDRRFLAVNTAALPDTLLESELFGHRRGSFTGADHDREGIFREVEGGSVFLDEVSSMSPAFQGKLLRVLQEKVVRPLGSSKDVEVDFRLIAATNRDLEERITAGEFRKDLFYRMGVMRIHLPPLRERPRDVVPLATHFLEQAARTCLGPGADVPTLSAGAIDALHAHRWPGNVREIENAIQRAVVVCAGDSILPHHLGLGDSKWGTDPDENDVEYAEAKRRAIERFQREFVQRALESENGNVSHAASKCGLTRAALQRILRQLDIDPDAFRSR